MTFPEFVITVRQAAPSAPLRPRDKRDRAVFYYGNTKYSCRNCVYAIVRLADHLSLYKAPKSIIVRRRANATSKREPLSKLIERFIADGDNYNANQLSLMGNQPTR